VAEFYITAVPSSNSQPDQLAREIFSRIRDFLRDQDARIVKERILATERALELVAPIRADLYGDLDDGVAPTWLVAPENLLGEITGVKIHAIRADQAPEVCQFNGLPCGRVLRHDGRVFVTLSGLAAPEAGDRPAQARAMLEKAQSALQQLGGGMHSVVRTWMWLGSILDWYDEFNRVRTHFFYQCGLIGPQGSKHLPASTGIGVKPLGRAECSLDVLAVLGSEDSIQHQLAGGNQGAASQYGSAFSRATKAHTPAGETVFVSGTAAINAAGETEYVDNAEAQIETTIHHVRAILNEMGCGESDIVQAVAYCKTREVEEIFRTRLTGLDWPCVTAIADICREELLFEIEATASVRARKL